MDPLIYFLNAVVFMGIYGIVALSLNLEYGFTGLGNFGKVAFFLVGAFAYAIAAEAGLHWTVSLIIAALASGAIGSLIALPALRLREDYLAITTLAFGEIIRTVVKAEDWIAHGHHGINVDEAIELHDASFRVQMMVDIGLVFGLLAVCYLVAQRMANSPYGRIMRAIREDDIAASSLGKNRLKYKAQVLFVGSAMAGIAGGLFAQFQQYIHPDTFLPALTFTFWIMVLLGGPANNRGVIVGAVLVTAFQRGAIIIKDYIDLPFDPINVQYILLGVLVILVLMFRPSGLFKESKIKTRAVDRALQWKNRFSE